MLTLFNSLIFHVCMMLSLAVWQRTKLHAHNTNYLRYIRLFIEFPWEKFHRRNKTLFAMFSYFHHEFHVVCWINSYTLCIDTFLYIEIVKNLIWTSIFRTALSFSVAHFKIRSKVLVVFSKRNPETVKKILMINFFTFYNIFLRLKIFPTV